MTDTLAPETPQLHRAPPSYIRLYAATGGGEASRLALEYAKSLLRIAPVRVIPADGAGIWPGYESLLTTKAAGTFVNVVACGPEAWCRTHRIEMPGRTDPFVGQALSSSWHVDQATKPATVHNMPRPKPEVVIERVDYWTAGVRNLLFAAAPPRDQWQLAAAKKFDVIVVPSNHSRYYWGRACLPHENKIIVLEPPSSDSGHAAIRALVLATETVTDTPQVLP